MSNYVDDDSIVGGGLPYLTFNASSAACFEFRESKDAELQTFPKVRGIMLGVWKGASCWPTQNGPFSGTTPVCKAHDVKQPAMLRKDLAPGEVDALERLGWTGDCASCGLAKKGAFAGYKPEQSIVFIWDSPDGPKQVLLGFKAWKAFLAVGAFVSRFAAKNPADYVVEFTGKRASEGGNNFGVVTCAEVSTVAEDQRDEMHALQDALVPAVRHRYPNATRPQLPGSSGPQRAALPPPEELNPDDIPF